MRILLSAVLALGLAAPASAADKITIGEPNWFSGKVAAMVLKEIFTSRYGYDAVIIEGSNPEIYHGMTGEPGATPMDIHADSWQPGHADWTGKAVAEGKMKLSANGYEGRIGFCAPQYTIDKLGLKTIADLKRPEVRKALDADGDGLVPVWVGGEGWQMTAAGEVKLRDYGLEPGYVALIASEGDYQEKLYAGFNRRRDMVFACYEPMSWFAMEHIGYIGEPAYEAAKHKLVMPSEAPSDWKARSHVTTGEQVAQVAVAWNTSLKTRFPRAAQLLEKFGLTNDDMVEFMFLADIKGIAIGDVVKDWVALNGARIEAWERGGS